MIAIVSSATATTKHGRAARHVAGGSSRRRCGGRGGRRSNVGNKGVVRCRVLLDSLPSSPQRPRRQRGCDRASREPGVGIFVRNFESAGSIVFDAGGARHYQRRYASTEGRGDEGNHVPQVRAIRANLTLIHQSFPIFLPAAKPAGRPVNFLLLLPITK